MTKEAIKKPENVDQYISRFSAETQKILEEIRKVIKKAAPEAEEIISYGMPGFSDRGRYLVYFAAYKKHIGLYPVPRHNVEFEKDFSSYKTSGKGTIQFPVDRPIPFDLITRIVKFRLKENSEKLRNK